MLKNPIRICSQTLSLLPAPLLYYLIISPLLFYLSHISVFIIVYLNSYIFFFFSFIFIYFLWFDFYFSFCLFYFLDNKKACDYDYMICYMIWYHKPRTLWKRLEEIMSRHIFIACWSYGILIDNIWTLG